MPFADRVDAGRQLAARLRSLRGDVVVLALPRGGVPVAGEVAHALGAPLDVILVRKLGVPGHPELAMGAIGEGGTRVANDDVIRAARITEHEWTVVANRERVELERRAQRFRGQRRRVPLEGRTAVLVDDGIATGATALAACHVARALSAARVVLAVPVASPSAIEALRSAVDEFVCLEAPAGFRAVGEWYDDFAQTTDDEVVAILGRSSERRPASVTSTSTDVEVPAGAVRLAGRLTIPNEAKLLVVFVHGSGSSRHSPRNQMVADVLNQAGLGTLLFDLLTSSEEGNRANVFDIELLGRRLVDVTRWLRANPATRRLDVAYFGASTGAGAALWAAAEDGLDIGAVVSRGGRPDLAGQRLAQVQAPTLLIVGSRDDQVLALNQDAASRLRCEHRVAVVPGATHLFEEPGTLQAAAELARDWYIEHLAAPAMTGTVIACPRCAVRNRIPPVATGAPRCAACHANLPWVVEAVDTDFAAVITGRVPVLVDLWAPWCAPCRVITPSVERAARELAGQLKVVMVNVEEAPAVARHLGVQSVPTLLVISNGRIVGRQIGAIGKARLLDWVRSTVDRSAARCPRPTPSARSPTGRSS